jgi:hypothetical protein
MLAQQIGQERHQGQYGILLVLCKPPFHEAAKFILSFRRHHQVVASGVINGLPRLNR